MHVECHQCGLNYDFSDEKVSRLAEKLQEIWWLRWAGDTECWPNMSPEYKKVWLDIASAALKPD